MWIGSWSRIVEGSDSSDRIVLAIWEGEAPAEPRLSIEPGSAGASPSQERGCENVRICEGEDGYARLEKPCHEKREGGDEEENAGDVRGGSGGGGGVCGAGGRHAGAERDR